MSRIGETHAVQGSKEFVMLGRPTAEPLARNRRIRRHAGWISAWLAVIALLGGCASTNEADASATGPATVEVVKGTDLSRITLTKAAMDRIDVQFGTVDGDVPTAQVPYSAVLYDPDGATWVFVNPEARTFVREPITVDRIEGDTAYLTAGPPADTKVVTVGAPEIYGAELGVGDDE